MRRPVYVSTIVIPALVLIAACSAERVTGPSVARPAQPVVIMRGTHQLSSAPLFIVDGHMIPRAASDPRAVPQAVTELLDNSQIASVEVIKGAAAEKLYGRDGANGVVVISTRGGS